MEKKNNTKKPVKIFDYKSLLYGSDDQFESLTEEEKKFLTVTAQQKLTVLVLPLTYGYYTYNYLDLEILPWTRVSYPIFKFASQLYYPELAEEIIRRRHHPIYRKRISTIMKWTFAGIGFWGMLITGYFALDMLKAWMGFA